MFIRVNGNFLSRICCDIFGQLYFWKSYLFTVFQSNFFQSITRVTFSEQFFLQDSSIFWGAPFSEQSLFPSIFFSFFQNIYLFRAKLLRRNQTLRIGNSLVQLPLRTFTNRRYLQKNCFFEPDSSVQYQLFQKKQDFGKSYFFRKAKFSITYFFWRANFLTLFSSIATFYSSYIFRRASFLQHTFSEGLLFHRYPSFPQLHLLLSNHKLSEFGTSYVHGSYFLCI